MIIILTFCRRLYVNHAGSLQNIFDRSSLTTVYLDVSTTIIRLLSTTPRYRSKHLAHDNRDDSLYTEVSTTIIRSWSTTASMQM
jgi:hypothetical protein